MAFRAHQCRYGVARVWRSVELRQRDGLAARVADAAVQGVLDDHGPDDLVGPGAVQPDDERPNLGVLTAGATPTKAA
jgi:hypothetical protein